MPKRYDHRKVILVPEPHLLSENIVTYQSLTERNMDSTVLAQRLDDCVNLASFVQNRDCFSFTSYSDCPTI